MSEKLLPCPFCGSAFKMGREPNDNHPVAGQFYLYHDYGPLGSLARLCPISINQHFYTEAEARAAWNTRAAIQADDDIERIKHERDQAVEALKTTNAWLNRWARHIGDCPGIDGCTCGLTRVRYKASAALGDSHDA